MLLAATQTFHGAADLECAGRAIVETVVDAFVLRMATVYAWYADEGRFALVAHTTANNDTASDDLWPHYEDLLHDLVLHAHRDAPEVFALDTINGVFAITLVDAHCRLNGVLVIWQEPGEHLSARHRRLLEALAFQAAVALQRVLENARDSADLRERVAQLEAVDAATRSLASSRDPATIAQDVVAFVAPAIDADIGRCVFCDDEGMPRLAACFDPHRLHTEKTLDLSARLGVVGEVVQSGQAVLLHGVTRSSAPIDVSLQTGAVLAVPLADRDRLAGVLVFEAQRPDAFSERDSQFITTLARHIVVALDAAGVHAQIVDARDELQALLDSANEAMLLFDTQGRLQRFNLVAERLLEQKLTPYVNVSIFQWLRAAERNRLHTLAGMTARQVCDYIRSIRAQPTERRTRRFKQINRDGVRHISETSSPVVDREGHLTGWLITWRDSTEEYHLEQMRQELSSMIVHDLRNPITSINSSLSMLRDLLRDDRADPEFLLEVVNIASSSVDYMANLVQSILDVSRLEQNNVSLDCESFALADCVDYALKSILTQAMSANIKVTTDVPGDLPGVWIDEEIVKRVLVNLLDNAVRHTPQDGEVHLRARYASALRMVITCVSDTGPGIPPEARARIFEKFTQLDQQAMRGYRGTGLGLAFCRLAVEAHGGRIWVEDGEAGGAVFCFTLPVDPPGIDLLGELDD